MMLQLSTSEENAVKKNSCGPEELESITYGDIILLVVSSEKEVVEMDLASPSSSMFRESHSFPGNPLNNFLIWTVYRAISFPTLQKESSDGLDWRRRFRKEYAVTQFIVDSGVASSSSILCTQPRKIDSISLGKILQQRPDSWSVTVDASKSFTYFFGCGTFQVLGRSFPIEIKCAPAVSRESLDSLPSSSIAALYVSDVIEMGMEIHASTSAIALPLHGKLSHEEQSRVFQNYPGKRELVFATNLAETSLTIPGVKYVVDSELVKHDWFESSSGMNALRVSKEPEICKVLLDIAVLRIPASGIKNVLGFDFIDDAPSADAINNIRILV
ncbi:hypothetical protein D5086_002152 [Populus alba]|uniref:Uncharacterized protein n=1 Tax=Populus alba TaxID=43335 RepID=A0ACC4D0Q3_POPAL